MATDLKQGVFYRPLYDLRGYGGTRYFPLYFCLHALLLKLGMPVLASAYLLSAAAIVLLVLGILRLLRELGVEQWLAACAAIDPVGRQLGAVVSVHSAGGWLGCRDECLGVSGNRPPAAQPSERSSGCAVFYAGVVGKAYDGVRLGRCCHLAGCDRLQAPRRGCWRAKLSAAICWSPRAMIVASHGRVVEIFRACASGGADWKFIASGPFADGVDGRLYRSRTGFVRCSGVCCCLRFLQVSSKLLQNLPALFLIAPWRSR